jgi:hypothetical protein
MTAVGGGKFTQHPSTPEDIMAGGLVGLISRSATGASGSIRAHDQWAIRLVFIAGIVTILHKAGVPIPAYGVVFAVCLGVAALLYEMNATSHALRSFWAGRPFSAIGWAFIWVVAFGYSMNQWVGAASENEGNKSNVHKASIVTYKDNRAEKERAEKELKRVEARIAMIEGGFEVNGVKHQVRGIEAAQADMDNAMAHKFWASTDGCKATKGPQTRDFCTAYTRARSEKDLAAELKPPGQNCLSTVRLTPRLQRRHRPPRPRFQNLAMIS